MERTIDNSDADATEGSSIFLQLLGAVSTLLAMPLGVLLASLAFV